LSQVTRLVAAELLKVRRRWLPYVLLVVMFLGSAMQIWMAGYLTWRDVRDEVSSDIAQALQSFVLPYSLPALLDTGQFWGSLLVGILTASVVATEYNWGTARQAIVRGQTRSAYLVMKLAGLAIVASLALLVTLAFGLLLSAWATQVAGEPVTFRTPRESLSAAEAVLMVLRAGYCVLPYFLLAFALTVVGRSTALGVAGILLYMVIESIVVAILGGLDGAWETPRAFTLGHNVAAVLAANNFGEFRYNSMALRDLPFGNDLPSAWTGACVIAAYCAIFLTVTFSVFQKRDMTSGAGAS
jgi:ABC-type transport system involved in multi-copper enzyme maturation permease subunit